MFQKKKKKKKRKKVHIIDLKETPYYQKQRGLSEPLRSIYNNNGSTESKRLTTILLKLKWPFCANFMKSMSSALTTQQNIQKELIKPLCMLYTIQLGHLNARHNTAY